MAISNQTARFSDRVDDYVKNRPHYPVEVIDLLAARAGLVPDSVIADVGSGTGILTQLFLENGNPVIGIEPNREMREAGETLLAEFGRFTSLDGTAEATKLPAQSMDFVVVGQAFHWFDRDKTRAEFCRILKPDAIVALIWNDRRVDSTPFLRDYEALLNKFGNDYKEVGHKSALDVESFTPFFGGAPLMATLENSQRCTREGLVGRLHSASYMPTKGAPNYAEMIVRVGEIFDAHARHGHVQFDYDTRVFYGRMA